MVNIMRKILVFLLLISLTACFKDSSQEKLNNSYDKYYQVLNSILSNVNYQTSSEYYDINFEYTKDQDGNYIYYVTIDDVNVAMNNIVVALDDVSNLENEKIIIPSKGIFEDITFNMIPNHANIENNYYEGIILSGVKVPNNTNDKSFDIRIYVEWTNDDYSKTYKEYLRILIDDSKVDVKLETTNQENENEPNE